MVHQLVLVVAGERGEVEVGDVHRRVVRPGVLLLVAVGEAVGVDNAGMPVMTRTRTARTEIRLRCFFVFLLFLFVVFLFSSLRIPIFVCGSHTVALIFSGTFFSSTVYLC